MNSSDQFKQFAGATKSLMVSDVLESISGLTLIGNYLHPLHLRQADKKLTNLYEQIKQDTMKNPGDNDFREFGKLIYSQVLEILPCLLRHDFFTGGLGAEDSLKSLVDCSLVFKSLIDNAD